MYLIDTNVWLERLLEQERSSEVNLFLNVLASDRFSISDFAFHSIDVVLCSLKKQGAFLQFAQAIFTNGSVHLIHLLPEDSIKIVQVSEKFNLDFDDAYQYTSAEKYNLILVSFDSDYDRTERGRKTPAQVLKELQV